ncbi:MAG: Uma2 family endonuclease [Phycisphaerales bacterium JB063]
MITTQTMTADQLYERSSELGRCELIKGELRMMSPAGGDHGAITMQIAFALKPFLDDAGGKLFAAETGFLLGRDPDTVRAPDVAYIAEDRLEAARTPKFIPIAPDFVAEVLSPNDRAEEVATKVQWWLDHGVRLVWVVDPANRCVTAHLPDGDAHRYRESDTLPGGDVMPGLQLAVSDLFG